MKLQLAFGVLSCVALSACFEASTGPNLEETFEQVEPDMQGAPVDAGSSTGFVAVRIGTDGPDLDACGGFGQVTGLNPEGDNFLAVRSAPTTQAEEIDSLAQGAGVFMCDYAQGWVGVVYTLSDSDETDCGAGSPVANVQDYSGPCRSGWVSEQYVELIAG